ncbi:MAG: ATP-binding cassette domain-containing protein, partial [Cellulosimicrobium funkei]
MVQVEGLHKMFGDLHVLKGVDLEVARGSVCVVLGPSGSGKSTQLRCVNELEEITGGRVRV